MIRGSIVAMVTPMREDGSVDWERLRGLVNWHVEQGTHGIVAVGTTVVRTLEAAALRAQSEGRTALAPCSGETDLFIQPGFRFAVIDGLITNFHLPESTLLMLVCAFGGKDRVMQAYQSAVAAGYRFFSYGDAMLVLPQTDADDV